MTAPLAVVLVIGQLTLGPFMATPEEVGRWQYVRDNVTRKADGWFECRFPTRGDECRAAAFSDYTMLCRRVMHDIGIGWRLSISGEIGWLISEERETLGFGDKKNVTVECHAAPDGFRQHNDDANYPDESRARCTSVSVDDRWPPPCRDGWIVGGTRR